MKRVIVTAARQGSICAWIAYLCAMLWAQPALAHHTSIGPTTGLSIPGLTHGQMAVISEYRSQILALADRQPFDSDETFFRLRNYVDLQLFYCGWGLMPDSITDEASAIEAAGRAPRLVRGDVENLKVTWPEDFALAERLLRTRGHEPAPRPVAATPTVQEDR